MKNERNMTKTVAKSSVDVSKAFVVPLPAKAKTRAGGPKHSPRDMPLKVMPFLSTMDMTCRHCGLTVSHTIGVFVKEAGRGNSTVSELEEELVCQRDVCVGPLFIDLKVAD